MAAAVRSWRYSSLLWMQVEFLFYAAKLAVLSKISPGQGDQKVSSKLLHNHPASQISNSIGYSIPGCSCCSGSAAGQR